MKYLQYHIPELVEEYRVLLTIDDINKLLPCRSNEIKHDYKHDYKPYLKTGIVDNHNYKAHIHANNRHTDPFKLVWDNKDFWKRNKNFDVNEFSKGWNYEFYLEPSQLIEKFKASCDTFDRFYFSSVYLSFRRKIKISEDNKVLLIDNILKCPYE